MIILEDTRQQVGKHDKKHEWFERNGVIIRRCKLYVGDYIIPNDGSVSIDTKENVLELIGDVHEQHPRFREECQRAQEAGIQLIVLTEEALPKGGIAEWKSPVRQHGRYIGEPFTRTNMTVFRRALITMQERYGVMFRFCRAEDAGGMIVKYLRKEI